MTFLDNFEAQCRARGETPSHALEGAGLAKSLYTKWKKQPERPPYGDTIQKLAKYFGCRFEDLEPSEHKRPMTDTFNLVVNTIACLPEQEQRRVLKYVQFTYGDYLPAPLQKMP